jgi:hypothetical protein
MNPLQQTVPVAGFAIGCLSLGWTLFVNSYTANGVPTPARLIMRWFGFVCIVIGAVIAVALALMFLRWFGIVFIVIGAVIAVTLALMFLRRQRSAAAGSRAPIPRSRPSLDHLRAHVARLLRRRAVKVTLVFTASVLMLATGAIAWRFKAEGPRPSVPLVVTKPPTTSPAVLGSDRSVHVSFTVRNPGSRALHLASLDVAVSRDGDETNFPDTDDVTVSPGQSESYSDTKVFEEPGTYTIWARVKVDGEWKDLGPRVQMNIVHMPSQFKLIKPLALSTWSPAARELVTATFTIENVSQQVLDFRVTAAVHPSNDPDWKHPFDFVECPSVTLQPGKVYRYQGSRSFPAGRYNVWPGIEIDHGWISDLGPWSKLTVHATSTSQGTPPSEGTTCPR